MFLLQYWYKQITDQIIPDPPLPQRHPNLPIHNIFHSKHASKLLLARLPRSLVPKQCRNRRRSPKQDRREGQSSTKKGSLQREEHLDQIRLGPNTRSGRQHSPLHWNNWHGQGSERGHNHKQCEDCEYTGYNNLKDMLTGLQDFVDIYLSGMKLWPAVSLISFTAIPANRRVIFGSLAGVAWNIYLSLKSSS